MMVHGCERDICCVKAIYRETVYLSRQGRADYQPRKETLTSRKGVLEFSKPENILLSLSGLRSNHASSILIGE